MTRLSEDVDWSCEQDNPCPQKPNERYTYNQKTRRANRQHPEGRLSSKRDLPYLGSVRRRRWKVPFRESAQRAIRSQTRRPPQGSFRTPCKLLPEMSLACNDGEEEPFDLSGEIEEEREEKFLYECARRDMRDGIDPNPTNWDNEDNE